MGPSHRSGHFSALPPRQPGWVGRQLPADSQFPGTHSGAIHTAGQGLYLLTVTPEPSAPSAGWPLAAQSVPSTPNPAATSLPPCLCPLPLSHLTGQRGPQPPLHQASHFFLTAATALGLCGQSSSSRPASVPRYPPFGSTWRSGPPLGSFRSKHRHVLPIFWALPCTALPDSGYPYILTGWEAVSPCAGKEAGSPEAANLESPSG